MSLYSQLDQNYNLSKWWRTGFQHDFSKTFFEKKTTQNSGLFEECDETIFLIRLGFQKLLDQLDDPKTFIITVTIEGKSILRNDWKAR